MLFSTIFMSALAALPTAFAIPAKSNDAAWMAPREVSVEPRADAGSVFYPNISKVYDLTNNGNSFTQFCSAAASTFKNNVDQRSMLYRFDLDQNVQGKKCSLTFEATGITLYYDSTFPITLQLFTTIQGTPLGCDDNHLNNRRDKHIADITISSSSGDVQWAYYSNDYLLKSVDCPTSGSFGYEVAIAGESKYAAWTPPAMGLMIKLE
ncbi:hypothetical protein CFIMG_007714RA00001 [Ceratocystis fimbriata CBS 114723]|uniref:Ubiquitin 3 binding protein But2 C-terminal domain-containing protein n=1 Tax=Ceratocystis fimbriata CBS 114723 TaxID=1035309 RepID=A0A2C5WVF7_9PEZI|nr:hypothetical protein CFIMG_007714RA00001 [Ceratocystis fimbriata CBS 114723]